MFAGVDTHKATWRGRSDQLRRTGRHPAGWPDLHA